MSFLQSCCALLSSPLPKPWEIVGQFPANLAARHPQVLPTSFVKTMSMKEALPSWLQEPCYTSEEPQRLCCSWSQFLGQEVGRKKQKIFTKSLLMAVWKAISSSCSLLELRISLDFILATHLLFSVIKSKIICFTTALSLDNPSEFQVDTSGIDSQQAAMHMVCLKNQCRRQSDVDSPAVCYHLSIYLFL